MKAARRPWPTAVGDHRGSAHDVARGEDPRHRRLQRAGVGLERAGCRAGLEAEGLGVGAHADGDDDDVALKALVLALVVLGVEASLRRIEHAGADLELRALHAALAGEAVDAPAVVQGDALGAGLFDLEVVGRHLLAASRLAWSTQAAPRRRALRAASMATLPPPTTSTRLPARSTASPSLTARKNSSALGRPRVPRPAPAGSRTRRARRHQHGIETVASAAPRHRRCGCRWRSPHRSP